MKTVEWRTSSYTSGGGACVEVASLSGLEVGVRDSKAPAGPVLTFGSPAWSAFVACVQRGAFDR
ncbi:hypothetical protein GCM10012275_07050 [Longimycelium tulufanense]|uniref:DUF397 domain-containing protein n=1 Tax=Longimycelium tulufanense TaxID=907463 RepID=A0A8J3C823_9PSEU|nr:DUF397 domain-containing protein [Longimycelium tulufanense]GGM38720.1 hypothetical protein GCM10012275_07050 [Longimycelium tulufanense]